ncbi:Hpt domain-containing protein [Arboricoccus pini]|uniref:Hpt domain-containing protein n=1 Tax=Arboricoccus pini TaxID=1963835 RepID=UPI000B51386A|nr:Hpt domain-containing protein [Arboricoccus pini]
MSSGNSTLSQAHARTVIDYSRLRSFTGDDIGAERDIIELYKTTAEQVLARLATALNDPHAWSRECHSLKGASINLGVLELGRLAAEAEMTPPSLKTLNILRSAYADLANEVEARDH